MRKAIRPTFIDEKQTFKITNLAEELGTTPRTIRLYEALGLIEPMRTEGGTRLFARKDQKRMAVALRLGRLGLDLETIQKLAKTRSECSSGKDSVEQFTPLLSDLQTRFRDMRIDLEILDHDITQAKKLMLQCVKCKNLPNLTGCPNCPMLVNIDISDVARLILDPACN